MRRIYEGCPDDELQAELDEIQKAYSKLLNINPDYHVTYFHVEGKYQVTEWGKSISKMHTSKLDAIMEVLNR